MMPEPTVNDCSDIEGTEGYSPAMSTVEKMDSATVAKLESMLEANLGLRKLHNNNDDENEEESCYYPGSLDDEGRDEDFYCSTKSSVD